MLWWIWVLAAVGCLIIELMTPGGFVFIFFAAGALAAALGEALHWTPEFWQQSVLAVTVACLGAVLFRRRLLHTLGQRKDAPPVDSMLGETVVAQATMTPGADGKVTFRGTSWKARNVGTSPIEGHGEGTIVSVDGITLLCKSRREA